MKRILLALTAFCLAGPAMAQTPMQPYYGSQAPSATGPKTFMQPVDTTHPLPVTPFTSGGTSVSAGLAKSVPSIQPTVAASSHASGSSVGGWMVVPFFRAASNFSGIVNNVQATWITGTNLTAVTVYLFEVDPRGTSTCTDAVAASFVTADKLNLVKDTPFTLTPTVVGAGSTSSTAYAQSPLATQNRDATAGVNLYACVVVNATVTPAANDFVLGIAGLQD